MLHDVYVRNMWMCVSVCVLCKKAVLQSMKGNFVTDDFFLQKR